MSDIYFNARGQTHHLRIRTLDTKPDDIVVYEAMTDGAELTFFEGAADMEVWELIELAVQSYLDYRVDETIVKLEWRAPNG